MRVMLRDNSCRLRIPLARTWSRVSFLLCRSNPFLKQGGWGEGQGDGDGRTLPHRAIGTVAVWFSELWVLVDLCFRMESTEVIFQLPPGVTLDYCRGCGLPLRGRMEHLRRHLARESRARCFAAYMADEPSSDDEWSSDSESETSASNSSRGSSGLLGLSVDASGSERSEDGGLDEYSSGSRASDESRRGSSYLTESEEEAGGSESDEEERLNAMEVSGASSASSITGSEGHPSLAAVTEKTEASLRSQLPPDTVATVKLGPRLDATSTRRLGWYSDVCYCALCGY